MISALRRSGFAGHTILFTYPTTEVNHFASLRTERTKGIIFVLDRLTAGWALHMRTAQAVFFSQRLAARGQAIPDALPKFAG